MDKTPDTFDKKRILRGQLAVLLLSAAGIGAFVGLWAVLGKVGMSDFPRLIVAFCAPPALIAILIGGYMLASAAKASRR